MQCSLCNASLILAMLGWGLQRDEVGQEWNFNRVAMTFSYYHTTFIPIGMPFMFWNISSLGRTLRDGSLQSRQLIGLERERPSGMHALQWGTLNTALHHRVQGLGWLTFVAAEHNRDRRWKSTQINLASSFLAQIFALGEKIEFLVSRHLSLCPNILHFFRWSLLV